MRRWQACCWGNLTVVNQSQTGTKTIQDISFLDPYAIRNRLASP